jgi:hypothetical protein
VTAAARELKIAPSTLLRSLNDGFVAGEQITPGAPWQIRLTDQLRAMLTGDTPAGWVPLAYATQAPASAGGNLTSGPNEGRADIVHAVNDQRRLAAILPVSAVRL